MCWGWMITGGYSLGYFMGVVVVAVVDTGNQYVRFV